MPDLRELKQSMRKVAEIRRAAAYEQKPDAHEALCRNFLQHIPLAPQSIVAGYNALRSEMNPNILMRTLHAQGCQLALPVITGRRQPLLFRAYAPDDVLAPGLMPYIFEPLVDKPFVQPTVLLVPMLAFDHRGYRLGYGGGYYDRTIRGLKHDGKALAIGIAFATQLVPEVPTGKFDVRLDVIVTENGVLRF